MFLIQIICQGYSAVKIRFFLHVSLNKSVHVMLTKKKNELFRCAILNKNSFMNVKIKDKFQLIFLKVDDAETLVM